MAMDMRGSLNLSKYFTKPNQPKYYGKALINGTEYVLKGWEKEGPEGTWISLLFEDAAEVRKKTEERNAEKFAPVRRPTSVRPPNNYEKQDFDDIPF